MRSICFAALSCCWLVGIIMPMSADAAEPTPDVRFRKLTLSEQFFSEGACFADIDGDGYNDVLSGPFWYQGPEFRRRHRYASGGPYSIKAYSQHFFSFAHDFNGDARVDILVVGMPGQPAYWFENPGGAFDGTIRLWTRHVVLPDAGGESPTLTDLTGDGKPELVCVHGGQFGYAEPNGNAPTQPWKFTPLASDRGYGVYTHGLGVGDVDNDGRQDVLQTNGWYQQPPNRQDSFITHQQKFAQSGGAQMFAYDFDGDGDNDVVSVQNAHAWGLSWFERRGDEHNLVWLEHPILSIDPQQQKNQLAISQMHALALADIDGDGIKDLITGKRFFAHGGGDPGAFQLPELYWFRTVRSPQGRVHFQPHLIDRRVGVGTQLTVGDINGDGRNDIVVGNKLGTYLLLNQRRQGDAAAQAIYGVLPGTNDFARGVRQSPHLSPEEELQTFVLPPGFEAQLVAAEPDITKPLNMAFDARGRLWITCTQEYPYPVQVSTPGRDAIKVLEDKDGDGRADEITTFADGLNIPIGLYPYKDGVICYSIPNIWFLRDTDGDGKCDTREKLYGPFDHTRDTHGMCNSFTRGFDGWLYACHGFNNQSTVAGRDGHQVTMHSGNTFRIGLDGERIEHYTHGQVNPFGMAYDARGNLLTADCHTKPVTLLLRGGYYESFGKPHDGLGFVPNVMEHLHGSTAIGGIAVCTEDTSFPKTYVDSAFGGNVMTSRVNRNSLIYNGSKVRAQEEADFLISGDPWFRPVDLQFGPDSALYIADFYNRIIGHYEVPLQHPGRDRTSGRIWRIAYRPNDDRRDNAPTASAASLPPVASLPINKLVEELGSPRHARRMLAADRLVDHIGTAAEDDVRELFEHANSPSARLHAMWVIFRLKAITSSDLDRAVVDKNAMVRTHAFRLLGELGEINADVMTEYLLRGLADSDAAVNRAAVLAAARHPTAQLLGPLLALYRRTSLQDIHLCHAIRMAIRDHLWDESLLVQVVGAIDNDDVQLIAGICLALKSTAARQFVAEHIEQLANSDRERLGEYIRFAMHNVSSDQVDSMVSVAKATFADDRGSQLELLRAVRQGQADYVELPKSIADWAYELATELLALSDDVPPIPWSFVSHPTASNSQNPWTISNRRLSADIRKLTLLWSSFPHGEQRTGVFRSGPFALPERFEFFIAGHDGFPGKPLQQKNMVRLRDAQTHDILNSWSPPRNDVAQRREWKTSDPGRQVYVELVDGDTATAYAWLAVGRFSVKGLNPSQLLENRRAGAALAGEFQLLSLRTSLLKLARSTKDTTTSAALVRAAANMQGDVACRAAAEAMAIALDVELRSEIIDAIDRGEVDIDLLARALKYATFTDQLRIASRLAGNRAGASLLLDLLEAGQANGRLLLAPAIRAQLDAVASPPQVERIEKIASLQQDEDKRIEELLAARRKSFLATGSSVVRGREIFQKNCMACHKVGNEGETVGPNLDGIGNRGLVRIVEDVLAPNRNVDVAFRASIIVTDIGRALTGLVQTETDTQLTLVDATGKKHVIDKSAIEEWTLSRASSMPANFGDVLDGQQTSDLLSYLLSLNR